MTKKTKYYAAYRVLELDKDRIRLRSEFYDEHPDFNTTGKHFMSFAADLGDLTEAQLEELKNRVGEERFEITVSDNWIADQKRLGTIFLISDSVYEGIGKHKHVGAATKLDLKVMRQRYVDAKTHRQFDKTIIAPLTHCIIHAEDIRDSKPATGAVPAAKKTRTTRKITIDDRLKLFIMNNLSEAVKPMTSKQLAKKLCEFDGGACSDASIRRSKVWTEGLKKDANARVIFSSDPEKLRATLRNQKSQKKLAKPLDGDDFFGDAE